MARVDDERAVVPQLDLTVVDADTMVPEITRLEVAGEDLAGPVATGNILALDSDGLVVSKLEPGAQVLNARPGQVVGDQLRVDHGRELLGRVLVVPLVVEVHLALGDVRGIDRLTLLGLLVGDQVQSGEDREADGNVGGVLDEVHHALQSGGELLFTEMLAGRDLVDAFEIEDRRPIPSHVGCVHELGGSTAA